jgi:hypothetical protein
MLDMVVDRRELKDAIARFLRFSAASAAPARAVPAAAAGAPLEALGDEPAS